MTNIELTDEQKRGLDHDMAKLMGMKKGEGPIDYGMRGDVWYDSKKVPVVNDEDWRPTTNMSQAMDCLQSIYLLMFTSEILQQLQDIYSVSVGDDYDADLLIFYLTPLDICLAIARAAHNYREA